MTSPKPTIIVSAPISAKRPPGTNWDTIKPTQYPLQSIALSWSWGTQPTQCNLVYTSESPIELGSAVKLTLGNYFFSGVCEADVPLESSRGRNRQLTFLDYRKWLEWDKTYCLWNKVDDRMINGSRVRRYMHILPWHHGTMYRTWTTVPYTAAQIIYYILGGPGIQTPWQAAYLDNTGAVNTGWHPNLGWPVYNLDCLNGKSLAVVLLEVSQQCGLLFTHMPTTDSLFRIAFAQKGVDGVEVTPPANSDDRQSGEELSGNPTRVRVLGDRNLYQVHNITLDPDWNTNWTPFYDANEFMEYVFQHFITWDQVVDPEQHVARQEARSLAMSMTLWEMDQRAAAAGLTAEGYWLDSRKYAGKSRNAMPCVLYINQLLFRSFRLPSDFWFTNCYGDRMYLAGLELVDKLLTKITHDISTGLTTYYTDPSLAVDGNAYVVVQGYQVGSDLFETVQPERFNLTAWASAQSLWQKVDVRIEDGDDPEGMRVVFEDPVIRSEDLVTLVDGYASFNAHPTITVPAVRATLTFAAEKFSWFQQAINTDPDNPPEDAVLGTQVYDDVLNVDGLNCEYIHYGSLTELPYADGLYARTKAIRFANNLLARQWVHSKGSFRVPLDPTTDYQLTGKIDRVSLDYNPQGKTVTVQLTNELSRVNYVPERELDRARQLNTLFPGQAELQKQAETARKLAATIRGDKDVYKLLSDAFHGNFTDAASAKPTVVKPSTTTSVPMGSVFLKPANTPAGSGITGTRPALQADADPDTETQFAGVTTRDNEAINSDTGATLRLQSLGIGLALVQGPVNDGDSVVTAPTLSANHLVKAGSADDTEKSQAVGVARQAITDTSVALIRVQFGVSAGSDTQLFELQSVEGDYLVCRSVTLAASGVRTVGEDDVYVAKDYPLRESLDYAVVDGQLVSYSYAASSNPNKTIRTASKGSGEDLRTEQQIVIPRWKSEATVDAVTVEADLITAVKVSGGSGVWITDPEDPESKIQLVWQEVSSRAWCQTS